MVRAAAVQLLCSWARSSVANCGAMATLGAGQILCTVSLETIVLKLMCLWLPQRRHLHVSVRRDALGFMSMISSGHSCLLSHMNRDGQM